MIDWYYHDPGQGRVGPFSAKELCKRYRDRHIQRDTLVWHEGLREWQPLERLTEELCLSLMRVDAAVPPPLPNPTQTEIASRPQARPAPAAAGRYSRTPPRQKKTLSTGAMALLVAAVLGIPAMLIISAVVLPAYQDYAMSTKTVGTISGLSSALKRSVGEYAQRTGSCPLDADPRMVELKGEIRRRASIDVRFGELDRGCAFELAINADGKPVDGKTLRYEGYPDGDRFAWDCSGGDLPDAYRPYECRRN